MTEEEFNCDYPIEKGQEIYNDYDEVFCCDECSNARGLEHEQK